MRVVSKKTRLQNKIRKHSIRQDSVSQLKAKIARDELNKLNNYSNKYGVTFDEADRVQSEFSSLSDIAHKVRLNGHPEEADRLMEITERLQAEGESYYED